MSGMENPSNSKLTAGLQIKLNQVQRNIETHIWHTEHVRFRSTINSDNWPVCEAPTALKSSQSTACL